MGTAPKSIWIGESSKHGLTKSNFAIVTLAISMHCVGTPKYSENVRIVTFSFMHVFVNHKVTSFPFKKIDMS